MSSSVKSSARARKAAAKPGDAWGQDWRMTFGSLDRGEATYVDAFTMPGSGTLFTTHSAPPSEAASFEGLAAYLVLSAFENDVVLPYELKGRCALVYPAKHHYMEPKTFDFRSGGSIRDWNVDSFVAQRMRELRKLWASGEEPLAGIEIDAVADFRPPEGTIYKARIQSVTPADVDLALSDEEWRGLGLTDDDE